MRVILLLILSVSLNLRAADPAWDWLPLGAYDDEQTTFVLRPDGGAAQWTLRDQRGAVNTQNDRDTLTATVPVTALHELIFSDGRASVCVRAVRPAAGADLHVDARGRLRVGTKDSDACALLTLPQIEVRKDRRWTLLRGAPPPPVLRCTLELTVVAPIAGDAALPALIVAAQALNVRGATVLIRVPGTDRLAGWKRRDAQLALSWLVADVLERGATGVVLAEPLAPASEREALAPLLTVTHAVGEAYHCPVIDLTALRDDALWELAPGILGPELNTGGRVKETELMAPWRAASAPAAASGPR